MFIYVWLSYRLVNLKDCGLISNRGEIFLFCILSRWSRNHPALYLMVTKGKAAGVCSWPFTSVCSQDYECNWLRWHQSWHTPMWLHVDGFTTRLPFQQYSLLYGHCIVGWLCTGTVLKSHLLSQWASIFPPPLLITSDSKRYGSSGDVLLLRLMNGYKHFVGM